MPVETSRGRRVYIDWARGLAVLLMIEAHTADAWTRAADRHSAAFAWTLVLGGFAAPLFLWLAGIGVALSAARLARTGGTREAVVGAICRRGLEIFILAFLFRLQAFIVTPGSYPITIFRVGFSNNHQALECHSSCRRTPLPSHYTSNAFLDFSRGSTGIDAQCLSNCF